MAKANKKDSIAAVVGGDKNSCRVRSVDRKKTQGELAERGTRRIFVSSTKSRVRASRPLTLTEEQLP